MIDKIVRSKMSMENMNISVENISHDEHVDKLRDKLIEEAVEYIKNPSVESLIDVYDVIEAIAKVDLGTDLNEINSAAEEKRAIYGDYITPNAIVMNLT